MQHSEKAQHPAANKSSSQPLRIDAPNSQQEKEAEAMADKVGRNGQIMGSENSMSGQIAGNRNADNGMIVPSEVKERINETKGTGDKLPEYVKRGIKGKSKELDEVRIHTDGTAQELSESVGAKAFTYGKHIYFGKGVFNTYTSEGREVIMHEVQHTLQNKTGSQEHSVIQRLAKAETAWGTFEEMWSTPWESRVGDYSDKYPGYGFGMYMKFTANDFVDAEKIGLVQISKEYEGEPTAKGVKYGDSSRKKHSISGTDAKNNSLLGENEEGFHIDRGKGEPNPLYAVTKAKSDQSLSQGETTEPVVPSKTRPGWYDGFGTHGEHYLEENGTLHAPPVPATLRDFPEFAIDKGQKAGAIFEVAALALKGKQEGKYYGSVKWGFTVDESGKQTPIPLTLVSKGAASTTFLKAAQMWNADAKVIPLPVPQFYELSAESTDFYIGKVFSAENKVPVKKPQRAEKMESTEKAPDSNPALIPVRLLEGELSGVIGWIDGGLLKQEDISITKPE